MQCSLWVSSSHISKQSYFKNTLSSSIKHMMVNYNTNNLIIINIDCLLIEIFPLWNKYRSLRWIQSLLFLLYSDWSPILLLISCIFRACNFLDIFSITIYSFQTSTPFSEVDIRRKICNVTGWMFWMWCLKCR